MFVRRQVKQSLRSRNSRTGDGAFLFHTPERPRKTRLFTFPSSNLRSPRHPHARARDVLRYSAQPSGNLTWRNGRQRDGTQLCCIMNNVCACVYGPRSRIDAGVYSATISIAPRDPRLGRETAARNWRASSRLRSSSDRTLLRTCRFRDIVLLRLSQVRDER